MSSASRRETALALGITILFLIVAAFLTARHEIWRDEAQAFLIAQSSASLDDLAVRLRFDGHPALWYVILFVLTRFATGVAALQAVHLLIAAAAVFLFVRLAPFPRFVRVLFAFSYFPLYEYGVIARNYSLGMLLLFAFCAVFPRRRRSLLAPAAILVLLAQTHLHMMLLAGVLAFLLGAEAWFRRREGRPRFLAVSAVLVLVSLVLGVYLVIPCGDSVFASSARLDYQSGLAGPAFRSLAKAYVAVPDPELHYWGNSILSRLSAAPVLLPLLSALFVLYAFLVLLDRPLVLLFYAGATAGLLSFSWLVYLGFIRHHGNLFLAFLAALWLAAVSGPEPGLGGRAGAIAARARRALPAVLGVLLALQVAGAAVAAVCEIRTPFSQARRTVEYIKSQGLDERVLVGDTHMMMAAVSAYLGRPIYYPYLEDWGTYCKYIHGAHETMSMTYIVAAAERLSRESGREYLLILSYPLDESSLRTRGLRPVAAFGSAVVEDETFYLYRRENRPSVLRRAAAEGGLKTSHP